MEQIYKYPRTRHLEGSKAQLGDEDLDCAKLESIKGNYLVLEEKVDGANCGISFGSDGRMYLQSRGHFLNGGYGERQFDLFKPWAGCFEEPLRRLLGDRYVMYGEWLYAKHTIFYDRLPHYFMEFDIFDKRKQRFYSTRKRREFLKNAPFVHSVRVLAEGYFETVQPIQKWIGPSLFISGTPDKNFAVQCQKSGVDTGPAIRQTDLTGMMEGIYIKVEDGKWVSPKHTIIGEKVFRQMAYREAPRFGLTFDQRETVAKLIRYHGLPVWFWTKPRPESDLLKAAESIPLRLLYLLSKADIQGRIAKDSGRLEEQVELFADYAKELGIWERPYPFANPYTKFQYFQKEDLWHKADLYDDTEFDVLLLSGLPLAGKDSWIERHGTKAPVISLDEIRRQHGIPPAKNTGRIAQLAIGQAKNFLRQQKPFIWNATNIIQETRLRLVSLFAGYGARVHILYLETPYQELLDRNQKRARYIPEPVLEDMIRNLELPAPWEAFSVNLPPSILIQSVGRKQGTGPVQC